MKIKVIAVGKLKESWIGAGVEDYLKRMRHYCNLELVTLKDRGVHAEAKDILSRTGDEFVIALAEEGKEFSSAELSELIKKTNKDLAFIIGSSDGLDTQVKQRADLLLSLSKMTFTHEMARLFLLEQLYRAFTILTNRKYHK